MELAIGWVIVHLGAMFARNKSAENLDHSIKMHKKTNPYKGGNRRYRRFGKDTDCPKGVFQNMKILTNVKNKLKGYCRLFGEENHYYKLDVEDANDLAERFKRAILRNEVDEKFLTLVYITVVIDTINSCGYEASHFKDHSFSCRLIHPILNGINNNYEDFRKIRDSFQSFKIDELITVIENLTSWILKYHRWGYGRMN